MSENVNYAEIEPDPEKRPEEYTFNERRAEIFRLWRESADPYGEISQTSLANRYDMAVSTIHNDIQYVKEFVRENIGADDEVKTDLGFERAIRNLEEQGKWYQAAKVREMKWDWLQNTGFKDKTPDKHEITLEDQREAAWHLLTADESEFADGESASIPVTDVRDD